MATSRPKLADASAPSAAAGKSRVHPLPAPVSDELLVAALKSGQPEAPRWLFDRYVEYVRRVLARIVGADADLNDHVQEVFIQAYRNIHKLREAARLRTWLAGIAAHTARHVLRTRGRSGWLKLVEPHAVPDTMAYEPAYDARDTLRAVYRVLEHLPARERIAFALRFIEGMSLPEMVEVLGVSLGTVKRRLRSANQRFSRLAQYEPALLGFVKDSQGEER